MPPRFDLLGLVVADMARSLSFYRLVGLDIPKEADTEGHVEIRLARGLRLAFDTVEVVHSFDAEWSAPSGGSRVALAFLCDNPEEVDGLFRQLTDAGHRGHHEPWDAFWGQRYATVLDPDGNAVDLFAPLP
ncbi:MAG: VOC family protein [Acidimicrobiia bacterium]|nr:VOC family protein [Acidimicrobiia bacterium]